MEKRASMPLSRTALRRSNEDDIGRVIATWMRASQWSLLAAALRRLAMIAPRPVLPAELRREESE